VQLTGMIKYVMVAANCHKANLGPEISNCVLDHSLKPSGFFSNLWVIYKVYTCNWKVCSAWSLEGWDVWTAVFKGLFAVIMNPLFSNAQDFYSSCSLPTLIIDLFLYLLW